MSQYAATYRITTNVPECTTSVESVDYWPDGYGQDYYRYITSFEQYKVFVYQNLTDEPLKFQFICPSSGTSKVISSDYDLQNAVSELDDRGVLLVTALKAGEKKKKSGNKNNKNKSKSKSKNKNSKWYDDEESDNDGSESEGSNKKRGKGKRKGKSIVDLQVEKKESKVLSILEHFDMQGDVECYYGGPMSDCGGVLYRCSYNSDYFLSPNWYQYLSEDEQEIWEEVDLHWGGQAPSYPLSYYDHGKDVKLLQYILTRLGLLKPEHTNQQTGWYLQHTQEAVSKFRKKFNVEGGNSTEYDKKTASKLSEVLKDLRKKGHKYL